VYLQAYQAPFIDFVSSVISAVDKHTDVVAVVELGLRFLNNVADESWLSSLCDSVRGCLPCTEVHRITNQVGVRRQAVPWWKGAGVGLGCLREVREREVHEGGSCVVEDAFTQPKCGVPSR
jgi:hypothetical protein